MDLSVSVIAARLAFVAFMTPTLQDLLRTAATLRNEGRYAEAAQAYRAVLGQAPHLAASWYNLGLCQRMSGQPLDALESYAQAIARGLDGAEEAHLNRAVILADLLRREAEAERELECALKLNPIYVPALLNLANLAEDFGRRAEAGKCYERALAADPACWEALARYANILPDGSDLTAMAARLQAALTRNDLAPADRASLGFALGRALDRSGVFDDAFAAYRQANEASRVAYGMRYDRAAAERHVRQVMEVFAQPGPGSTHEWAPIFICGMFRSGSTLLEQVLAGCARITPGGEAALVSDIVRTAVSPFPERARLLSNADFVGLGAYYREMALRIFPSVDLITDKWLGNTLHVGLIKRMFPSAKIVHTTRHELDNVLSVYFLHLDASFGYAIDLDDIVHQMRLSKRLMAHWRTLYPGDIREFEYDAFVAAPEAKARSLLEWLGFDWQPECLAFQRRTNAVKTASVWQVRQPLYTSSSGRWRHYERYLTRVREALG
jgi:tetratricopeptide (TPR) repeat protein